MPSKYQEAILCLFFWGAFATLWSPRDYTWYLYGPLLGTESLRPRTRHKQQKETRKKKEEQRRAKGCRRMKTWRERGRRARLPPLVALIMLAVLRVVVVFFFYVGILCVCGSSTCDASTRAAAQTKVLLFFFLLLTSYILWTLFSESYWSSRPQRHTTAEKNGVSVVLHRSVRPSQSYGTMRGSGKP